MAYIHRSIEERLVKASETFKAVLVTGPRQVGKSTMLKKVFPDRKYVTLDDPFLEEQANQNGSMFMMLNQPPITFDEVQRAPILFRYIKMKCDETDNKGLYCLSGSQQFKLMQNVSETLSGRISILELAGLSLREMQGDPFNQRFLPTMEYILERQKTVKVPENIWEISIAASILRCRTGILSGRHSMRTMCAPTLSEMCVSFPLCRIWMHFCAS